MKSIEYWKNKLNLEDHPEGGFFSEFYRSQGFIPKEVLPERFSDKRNYSTAIYFLITSTNNSKFHKINADEMWHFYYGSPVKIHLIDLDGNYSYELLGLDLDKGQLPAVVIPHQTWMAAETIDDDSYSLVGCTSAPGFDYADFVMATKNELLELNSEIKDIIQKFI